MLLYHNDDPRFQSHPVIVVYMRVHMRNVDWRGLLGIACVDNRSISGWW